MCGMLLGDDGVQQNMRQGRSLRIPWDMMYSIACFEDVSKWTEPEYVCVCVAGIWYLCFWTHKCRCQCTLGYDRQTDTLWLGWRSLLILSHDGLQSSGSAENFVLVLRQVRWCISAGNHWFWMNRKNWGHHVVATGMMIFILWSVFCIQQSWCRNRWLNPAFLIQWSHTIHLENLCMQEYV